MIDDIYILVIKITKKIIDIGRVINSRIILARKCKCSSILSI